MFFFEKKNQKTFFPKEVFLLLFVHKKKTFLPCPCA